MNRFCDACEGTGRFQARFGGPNWPLCPECMGTGQNGHRTTIDDMRAAWLSKLLEKTQAQEALLHFIRDEFLAALAALTAATSSYKNFTGSAKSRGKRDPLFATKLADYEKAVEQAKAAYEEVDTKMAELKKSLL